MICHFGVGVYISANIIVKEDETIYFWQSDSQIYVWEEGIHCKRT